MGATMRTITWRTASSPSNRPPSRSALRAPLADIQRALSRENYRPMNSTRSALPAFISASRSSESSALSGSTFPIRGPLPAGLPLPRSDLQTRRDRIRVPFGTGRMALSHSKERSNLNRSVPGARLALEGRGAHKRARRVCPPEAIPLERKEVAMSRRGGLRQRRSASSWPRRRAALPEELSESR